DGTVYGTGYNGDGELGLGNTNNRTTLTPMILPTDKTPSQIACGGSNTIVLMNDGTVYGTGYNGDGELGLGNTNNRTTLTPMILPTDKTPSQIVCGIFHTIVIMNDKTVYGTGYNRNGELGLGNYDNQTTLRPMILPTDKIPSQIACGIFHTIVLMNDGTVYGTGYNTDGQLGLGNYDNQTTLTQMINVTDKMPSEIVCGGYHTVVLMNDGTISGVGSNNYGQLGVLSLFFSKLNNTTGKIPSQIACSYSYVIVLMNDGTIYGTGYNENGELGLGNYDYYQTTLTPMILPTGKLPTQIACGGSHTIVLMNDGTVYGTGYNGYGQLGLENYDNQNTLTPIILPTGKIPSQITCGDCHTIILMNDGTVYGTGYNGDGELGLENYDDQTTLTPMILPTGKIPSQIECGGYHTIVLMNDGTIYGTGYNGEGELGLENYDNQNTLTQIILPSGKIPSQIACGESHTIVRMNDGTVYGTGYNGSGQLGLGNYDGQVTLTPMILPTGEIPSQITCGGYHTIVLMNDGTVYGTGYNGDGELG
ncbi:MAG: hypothetical protein WCK82_15895, partial [Bacteroidota bacterium]